MTQSRALVLGRLLRLSLLPSALADVVVGCTLGAGGRWPGGAAPWLLIVGSLGVYHGGMALNDWADRARDAAARPERPLPSGALPARLALAIAVGLFLGGVAAAGAADRRLAAWMGAVALLAATYDLAGRGPWRGPALLALCRAGNLGAGLALGSWSLALPLEPARLAPALLYGAYVFAVSRLGRLEDEEDPRPLGTRPARALRGAALVLALIPALAVLAPYRGLPGPLAAALVALPAAAGLLRLARDPEPWTRARVGRATGAALRRLLPFTAACALLLVDRGAVPALAAAVALAGYPLSFALRRAFPPS